MFSAEVVKQRLGRGVFCLLFGRVAHLLDSSPDIHCFPLGFWKEVISKLLMISSYTQKRKRGSDFPKCFWSVVISLTLLLLIYHCSDGEFELVYYFYDRILKNQKAGELTNKNVPPSLIFIVLRIKSVFVLPCLKSVSCRLHLV